MPESHQLSETLSALYAHYTGSLNLMVSNTNFSLGEAQAPSRIWIIGALEQGLELEQITHPGLTRWDSIQKQSLKIYSGSK